VIKKGMDKFRSYKMSDVAKSYGLPISKDDVEYHEMYSLFHGSDADRYRLAKYCARDVDVTVELMGNRNMVNELISSCQVTMTRCTDFLTRGQTFKYRRALRGMIKEDYVILHCKYGTLPPIVAQTPSIAKLYAKVLPALPHASLTFRCSSRCPSLTLRTVNMKADTCATLIVNCTVTAY
jgi:hypothetical protein